MPKQYTSLNEYLQASYGHKLYKLALNGGCSCPNRDGRLDTRGCIFCSAGGSGEFASSLALTITEQIEQAKKLICRKMPTITSDTQPALPRQQYIAYFQAYTNTYAPIDYLRCIYMEAVMHPDVAVLSIATRPDCLGGDVLDLLTEINRIKPVWIELGLQSMHEDTAVFIRRGYSLNIFENALQSLQERGIPCIVHLILGLPYETPDMMLESVRYVCSKKISGIKLQLLHVLRGTDLEQLYNTSPEIFPLMNMDDYLDVLIKCISIIPRDIVIHRLTGDGDKKLLVAPTWSANKKLVLNTLSKRLSDLQ